MKIKHGHTTKFTQSPTYVSYQNMISRCHRENHPKYPSYGGKGIFVCDRWRESFENFLQDMGERPDGTTIDRIDGTQGYTPSNCRWSFVGEQQANISSNVVITFNGKTQHASAWAREIGITPSLLAWRIRQGWSVDQALSTAPKLGNRAIKTGQRLIECFGKTQCLSEWAREYGMSVSLLRLRLSKGLDIKEALTKPKGVFVTKSNH